MTTIFGIRHHGPGSTKSLLRALQNLEPDCLLIEGVKDAEALLQHVVNPGMQPPVALLTYNPKDFSQAIYSPFAEFSPEWQAIKYGLGKNISVQFMDLPHEVVLGIKKEEAENPFQLFGEEETDQTKNTTEDDKLQKDPLGYMAEIAGYTDSERWWEVTFEERENPEEIFPSIIQIMRLLREEMNRPDPPMEKRREAFMRETMRKAIKDGYQNIAVICGAWHSPVLEDLAKYKASDDKKLLRGIKKVKTKSTWVPWSYNRLSTQSGYGAGVISPAWYKLLYTNRKEVGVRWMTKVARLFREKDMDASSAHVIEAVRLAETLASIRQLPIAGIGEMYEAATSIFCEGHESQMELIQSKLIIGDVMGKVPPEVPVIPLQQDFDKSVKSARLTKERNSTDEIIKELDLRTESNLRASHLLHRLDLLGIKWGQAKKASKFSKGQFKEIWKLVWKPDYALNIISAGMWGNTVYEASVNFVKKKTPEIENLPELTQLVETALKADLTDAIPKLVKRLRDLSALTTDVEKLMLALRPLIYAIRYGSTRKLDVSSLERVINEMIPRICVLLPNACVGVNEDFTKNLFEKILDTNHSISLMDDEEHLKSWNKTLDQITRLRNVNTLLKGGCLRMLFDKKIITVLDVSNEMYLMLSVGNDTTSAANWLEGFLHGSGLLLIHNMDLWNILDQWIDEMNFLTFQNLIPLLRRTFSEFSAPEKEKMLELAKRGQMKSSKEKGAGEDFDKKRGEGVLETVKLLLGM